MKKSYLAHAALGAIALAVLAACSSSSTPSTEQVPTTAAPANLASTFRYQLVLANALSGAAITDTLQVEVKGTAVDADKVVDAAGQSVKGRILTVTNGLLALGAELTETTSFSVVAGNRLLGWNESGKQFTLATSRAGDLNVTIPIVKVGTAADIAAVNSSSTVGVAVAAGVASTTGGAINATQVASVNRQISTTEGITTNTGSAGVSVPAGTRALNAQGQPITPVGTVSLTVTAYSPNTEGSLEAFPGGFAANVNVPAGSPAANLGSGSSNTSGGSFVSGGFAQFNMTDSAGNALKTFDKPLTLTIPLPKSTRNAAGGAIAAGDDFPVWSFDEVTGVWKFEKMGKVREKTPVDPANFEVVFESNHLSSWNLDYYQNSCTTTFTLNRGTDTQPLRVVITGANGWNFSRTLSNVTDSVQNLLRSPGGSQLNVAVFNSAGVRVGGTSSPISTCSTGTQIPLTIPAPPPPATAVVNVTESCANGTGGLRGSPAMVYVYNGRTWTSGTANRPTGSATTAAATITLGNQSLPSSPVTGTAYAWNRYTNRWATQAISLTNGQTTTVNFNFPNLQCTTGGAPL
jgi:hypothetical protein